MGKVGRGTYIIINSKPGAMKFQKSPNKPTVTSSPKIFLKVTWQQKGNPF